MTQIGIGQLKNSKPVTQQTQKPLQKFNVRPHESPIEEGQLSVDIIHREDQMTIICPIAGVDKTEIKVAIQDDVLTIRGERKRIPGMEKEKAIVSELFWGVFSRSIVLPDHIDRKKIEAKVHEHMLIISIPKTEDFKTRIIHINGEE